VTVEEPNALLLKTEKHIPQDWVDSLPYGTYDDDTTCKGWAEKIATANLEEVKP
jgi:hypothetical protein